MYFGFKDNLMKEERRKKKEQEKRGKRKDVHDCECCYRREEAVEWIHFIREFRD
jgi:hypothetical protein